MKQLQDLPAWQQLWAHFDTAKDVHMRDLFERDPNRGDRRGDRGADAADVAPRPPN